MKSDSPATTTGIHGPPTSPSATLDSQPPTIPDHELLKKIGDGSYGEVWLARNAVGTLRAIKIVHRKTFWSDHPFEREFKGIQKFEPISRSHEGLVDVLQIGRGDGYFYYVMELADPIEDEREKGGKGAGENLPLSPSPPFSPASYAPKTLDSLRRPPAHFPTFPPAAPPASQPALRTRLPPAECIRIGLALTDALAHLHGHGLVHRDIKPANIIFVGGVPKLADIGLVAEVSEARSYVGTEGFIPPEGPGTPQADLYSLGKLLYEISTGQDRHAFPALPPDLAEQSEVQQLVELNAILLKACQPDPRKRYHRAEEMLAELELLRAGQSVRRSRGTQRLWAWAKKIVLGLVLLALMVAGIAIAAVIISAKFHAPSNQHATQRTKSPEAERLYQQAVYQMQSRSIERVTEAYRNLAEAVKLDPNFVDAWYQLFEVYFGVTATELPPHYNRIANFRMVTTKLREISPNSAQYRTANSLACLVEFKFEESVEEARLATQLDPSFPRAHGLYGYNILHARGDTVTALRELRIEEQLNAADTTTQGVLGGPYFVERKFAQAIQQFRKAVQLEPRVPYTHAWLGEAYEADGQYENAIDEYEKARLLNGADPAKTRLAFEQQRDDLREKGSRGWRQGQLDEARRQTSPDSHYLAQLCARLGNTDEVFIHLERAYLERNVDMIRLLYEDCWDPIRSDPRFKALLKKVGYRIP